MARRLLDAALAALALLVTAPLLAVAAVGIRLSSPGPVLYRAPRAGRGRRPFTMYKLRTMRVEPRAMSSVITADRDPRIFPFGAWLRRTKIDELPQLLNVVRGDMAIVGPRPEDLGMVERGYWPIHFETLEVSPGLTSPGSLYNYTHGERLLTPDDPERHYIERLLPIKLALDVVYVRRRGWWYDTELIFRTVRIVVATIFGQRAFPDPPEMAAAQALVAAHGPSPASLALVSDVTQVPGFPPVA